MNSHHEERGPKLGQMEKNQILKNRDFILSEFQFSLSHYILRPNFNAVSGIAVGALSMRPLSRELSLLSAVLG